MSGYQNLHTHTKYCDGAHTPEELISAALERGCDSLGFSGHSYVPFDMKFAMSQEAMAQYLEHISRLKDEYEGIIEVFLGMEYDYYTPEPVDGLDYCIGALHYVKKDGNHLTIDGSAELQQKHVDTHFGGDWLAMAEEYYETISRITTVRKIDIIAHFDVIAKYNFHCSQFDDGHPRYRSAAIGAMEEILKDCRLFEVNTGMMFKKNKYEPYPSVSLLKELHARGGEVILSSDSHKAESLCYKFDDMMELLKSIGFRYIKRLTKSGFTDQPL